MFLKRSLRGTTTEMRYMIHFIALINLVDTLLNASICFHHDWKKNASVLEIEGDVLVVPQASLCGKFRGKTLQYHGLCDKDLGAQLYEKFIGLIAAKLSSKEKTEDGTLKICSIIDTSRIIAVR